MKALILNSGMGSRMGEETKKHPKCMTVLNGDETILSRQLKQLEKAGITEVIITTGYLNKILEEYCKTLNRKLDIEFVYSAEYEKTNYIYSIYLAKELLQDDIVMLHGDLVFSTELLKEMLKEPSSCMAVDNKAPLPEKDFKAVAIDDKIQKVGISFFEQAVAAQPLYKLKKKDWTNWLDEIVRFCESGEVKCYAENAFNEVSDKCVIKPYDIKKYMCQEIDTIEDWENVKKKIEKEENRIF